MSTTLIFLTSLIAFGIYFFTIYKITKSNSHVLNGMFYGVLGSSFIITIFQIIQGKEMYVESISNIWDNPITNIITQTLFIILMIICAINDYKDKE